MKVIGPHNKLEICFEFLEHAHQPLIKKVGDGLEIEFGPHMRVDVNPR